MKLRDSRFDLYNIVKYRSVLMGISIILIIFHHLTIRTYSGLFGKIYAFLRLNAQVGVNIFVFLSAVGLCRSYAQSQGCILEFYKRRIIRILPAYILIAGFFYAIDYDDITTFFYNLFFLAYVNEGRGYWFIFAILCLYLMFPFIYKTINRYGRREGYLVLICTWIISLLILAHFYPKLFSNFTQFLPTIPAFFYGVYSSEAIFTHKNLSKKNLLIAYFFFIVSNICVAPFYLKGVKVAYSFWPRLFFLPMSVSLIIIICKFLENSPLSNIVISRLGNVGLITLELYLLHQRMIAVFVNLLSKTNSGIFSIVIGNVLGIFISFLSAIIIHKVIDLSKQCLL